MAASRMPELLPEELKKIITASTELAKEAVENNWLTLQEKHDSMDFLIHIGEDCDKVMAHWAEQYLIYLAGEKERRIEGTRDRPNKIFFIPTCPEQCSNCSGVLADYYCQRKVQCPCRCHNTLIRKIISRIFQRLFFQSKGDELKHATREGTEQ